MLCYVTLCYVTLCYVMLHYVMLCYIILYYITLFYRIYIYMQVRHLCHHLWRGLTVSLKKNAKWWIFWPSKRPFFLELIFSPFLSNFSKILKHHIQTYHGWPESPNLSMGHFSSTLFEALNYLFAISARSQESARGPGFTIHFNGLCLKIVPSGKLT